MNRSFPSPDANGGGYRLYQEREVADLEFIQKAHQLGISLNEIRELTGRQRGQINELTKAFFRGQGFGRRLYRDLQKATKALAG